MNEKSVCAAAVTGLVSFGFGALMTAITLYSALWQILLLVLLCIVLGVVVFRMALEDCKWLEEFSAAVEEETAPMKDSGTWQQGYDVGYASGFDDAAESLQFTRPVKIREGKTNRRGA